VAAGVDFYCAIDDRDDGMRDFSVRDPDGNQIGIGAVGTALAGVLWMGG
jgi:hypothetical protein